MNLMRMGTTIADLPKGRLDSYRKRATFDWKLMKLNLEGEDFVKFQVSRTKVHYNSRLLSLNGF